MEEKTVVTETEFRRWCDDAIEPSRDERSLGREILARVWQRLGEKDPYGSVPSDGHWPTLDRVLRNRCEANFDWHRILIDTVEKAREGWARIKTVNFRHYQTRSYR